MNSSALKKIIKEEIMKVLKEDIRDKLIKKAKSKEDGIYSYDGVLYRVKDGNLTHYAKNGEIIQASGYFDAVVGKYEFTDQARKKLKSI